MAAARAVAPFPRRRGGMLAKMLPLNCLTLLLRKISERCIAVEILTDGSCRVLSTAVLHYGGRQILVDRVTSLHFRLQDRALLVVLGVQQLQ